MSAPEASASPSGPLPAVRPWQPGALVRLETPRFVLRSLEREDVDASFLGWLADPEVMLGLNLPRRRLSRAEAVGYVLSADHHRCFRLGIAQRPAGPLIGWYAVDLDLQHGWAETSVVVGDRSWWGRDVVQETRSRLLDFLFDDVGLVRVMGRPHGRNIASIYNYKRLGFRCEGVLRQHLLAPDGHTRLDQLVFGLLRDDWRKQRGP